MCTLCTTTMGAQSSLPESTFKCKESSHDRQHIETLCAFLACEWIYGDDIRNVNCMNLDSDSLEVLFYQTQQGLVPVQWALLRYQDNGFSSLVLVFRGTNWKNVMDIILDLSAVPMAAPVDSSVVVHSGMWAATHMEHGESDEANVSSIIKNQLELKKKQENQENQEKQEKQENLYLCGHSLGAGFALMTALDLLHDDETKTDWNIHVRTFGAPQVLYQKPDHKSDLWKRLHQCTTSYVSSFDIIPRLPSNSSWMDKLGPIIEDAAKKRIGIFGEWKIHELLQRNWAHFQEHKLIMSEFRPVGSLVQWDNGSEIDASDLRNQAPPETTNYMDYLAAHRCYRHKDVNQKCYETSDATSR